MTGGSQGSEERERDLFFFKMQYQLPVEALSPLAQCWCVDQHQDGFICYYLTDMLLQIIARAQ